MLQHHRVLSLVARSFRLSELDILVERVSYDARFWTHPRSVEWIDIRLSYNAHCTILIMLIIVLVNLDRAR